MMHIRTNLKSYQRGLSFISVVFIGVLAVGAFAVGGQSVPIFIEYMAIKKAATKAARESTSVQEVRGAFDRSAAIDNIESVSGATLEVTKQNEKMIVRYKYSREIALAGPAYLVYRFEDQVSSK